MNSVPLILCLLSIAQITPAIPESATVFTVTYKDGGDVAVVNAAIRARDVFVDVYDRGNLPARLELVLDEPWNGYPSEMVLVQNIVEAEPEPSAKRKGRYESSGFEQITADTGTIWIPAETNLRYERMKALQEELEDELRARYTPMSAEESAQIDTGGPGFAALWWRHVVILVFTAVSLVVAVKVFFQ